LQFERVPAAGGELEGASVKMRVPPVVARLKRLPPGNVETRRGHQQKNEQQELAEQVFALAGVFKRLTAEAGVAHPEAFDAGEEKRVVQAQREQREHVSDEVIAHRRAARAPE